MIPETRSVRLTTGLAGRKLWKGRELSPRGASGEKRRRKETRETTSGEIKPVIYTSQNVQRNVREKLC